MSAKEIYIPCSIINIRRSLYDLVNTVYELDPKQSCATFACKKLPIFRSKFCKYEDSDSSMYSDIKNEEHIAAYYGMQIYEQLAQDLKSHMSIRAIAALKPTFRGSNVNAGDHERRQRGASILKSIFSARCT